MLHRVRRCNFPLCLQSLAFTFPDFTVPPPPTPENRLGNSVTTVITALRPFTRIRRRIAAQLQGIKVDPGEADAPAGGGGVQLILWRWISVGVPVQMSNRSDTQRYTTMYIVRKECER